MSLITTIKAPEQFILQVNGDYNVLFDAVAVTVAGALPAGNSSGKESHQSRNLRVIRRWENEQR